MVFTLKVSNHHFITPSAIEMLETSKIGMKTSPLEMALNLKANPSKENNYRTILFSTQEYYKEALRVSKMPNEMDKDENPLLKFTPDTFNINTSKKPKLKPAPSITVEKKLQKPGFCAYFREKQLYELKVEDVTLARQALEDEMLQKAYKVVNKDDLKKLPESYIKTRYVS